jgi:hypothetical protein
LTILIRHLDKSDEDGAAIASQLLLKVMSTDCSVTEQVISHLLDALGGSLLRSENKPNESQSDGRASSKPESNMLTLLNRALSLFMEHSFIANVSLAAESALTEARLSSAGLKDGVQGASSTNNNSNNSNNNVSTNGIERLGLGDEVEIWIAPVWVTGTIVKRNLLTGEVHVEHRRTTLATPSSPVSSARDLVITVLPQAHRRLRPVAAPPAPSALPSTAATASATAVGAAAAATTTGDRLQSQVPGGVNRSSASTANTTTAAAGVPEELSVEAQELLTNMSQLVFTSDLLLLFNGGDGCKNGCEESNYFAFSSAGVLEPQDGISYFNMETSLRSPRNPPRNESDAGIMSANSGIGYDIGSTAARSAALRLSMMQPISQLPQNQPRPQHQRMVVPLCDEGHACIVTPLSADSVGFMCCSCGNLYTTGVLGSAGGREGEGSNGPSAGAGADAGAGAAPRETPRNVPYMYRGYHLGPSRAPASVPGPGPGSSNTAMEGPAGIRLFEGKAGETIYRWHCSTCPYSVCLNFSPHRDYPNTAVAYGVSSLPGASQHEGGGGGGGRGGSGDGQDSAAAHAEYFDVDLTRRGGPDPRAAVAGVKSSAVGVNGPAQSPIVTRCTICLVGRNELSYCKVRASPNCEADVVSRVSHGSVVDVLDPGGDSAYFQLVSGKGFVLKKPGKAWSWKRMPRDRYSMHYGVHYGGDGYGHENENANDSSGEYAAGGYDEREVEVRAARGQERQQYAQPHHQQQGQHGTLNRSGLPPLHVLQAMETAPLLPSDRYQNSSGFSSSNSSSGVGQTIESCGNFSTFASSGLESAATSKDCSATSGHENSLAPVVTMIKLLISYDAIQKSTFLQTFSGSSNTEAILGVKIDSIDGAQRNILQAAVNLLKHVRILFYCN